MRGGKRKKIIKGKKQERKDDEGKRERKEAN